MLRSKLILTHHYSSPWAATPDAGACVVLPETPEHSDPDPGCSGRDTAPEAEPNGSLFYAAQIDRDVCNGSVVLPGRLSAPNDVDLFQFPECPLPFVDPDDPLSRTTNLPTVSVDSGDDGTEVCLFAACSLGPTRVSVERDAPHLCHAPYGLTFSISPPP